MKINISPSLLILTVAFVILKVTGAVDWSWFWVLSPLIFGAAFVLGIGLIVFGGWLFAMIILALATQKTLTCRPKKLNLYKS